MQPISIKSCLKSTLKNLGLYEAYRRQRALILWDRICGAEVAGVAVAESLKGNVLFVAAKDHIWASELSNYKLQYLQKYEKLLGKGIIRDIRFRGKPNLFETGKKKKAVDFDPEAIELNKKEQKKVDDVLADIKDEKTREVIQRFFLDKIKHDRWLKRHGGQECFGCGVMIEKGKNFCLHCTMELEKKNAPILRELIENTPWISFEEAVAQVNPITRDLFLSIKESLAERIHGKIAKMIDKRTGEPAAIKSLIITLVMLKTGKKPAQLKDGVIRKAIPSYMHEFFNKTF